MRSSRRSRPDPPLFFIRVVVEEPFELELRRVVSRARRYAFVHEAHYYWRKDKWGRAILERAELLMSTDHQGLFKFKTSISRAHVKNVFIRVEKTAIL